MLLVYCCEHHRIRRRVQQVRRTQRTALRSRYGSPHRRLALKVSPFPIEFPPPRIGENHGRFDLPFRHGPVLSEKTVLLPGANDSKAMLFVKADRPYRIRPGSDQYRTWRQLPQMSQQVRSNSSLLAAGGDVGVPNQSHILDLLNAHHTYQLSSLLVSPERNAVIDFIAQLVPGHLWFCPAIFTHDAFIRVRAIVDDGPNQLKVAVITAADHDRRPPSLASQFTLYESHSGFAMS